MKKFYQIILEEIRQLGKESKQPEIPDNLKQIYENFIQESYIAALATENGYDIKSLSLLGLQNLLNDKIMRAKDIYDSLHTQYEKYLTEKDTYLAELTQS